jgi:hypothetical protein
MTMKKLIEHYGSIEAVVERLNQLGSQQQLAKEANVSTFSVVRFMALYRVERVVKFERAS